mgnify:FL=1
MNKEVPINMDTVVLKFGGSSVADNIKLNIVADKILEYYQNNNVIVVVSAQGKTTDGLIKQAKELSAIPDCREMDVLLSTGEQITTSKLCILLKRMGYEAVSLTGWQAGILTDSNSQEAKIEAICTDRIQEELAERRIVVIAGFQGIDEKGNITTLGRGGSDTTAVAIAAAIQAAHCYIFSDVDGVYTTDPNKVTVAKKLESLSYEEMLDISNEGAKVLHNRCVEIGERFHIPIVTKSTFNNQPGSTICDKVEDTEVKSIVKNDNIILVKITANSYRTKDFYDLYAKLVSEKNIAIMDLSNKSNQTMNLSFTIKLDQLTLLQSTLETDFPMYQVAYKNITRISIIGYGILKNNDILNKTISILQANNLEVTSFDVTGSKIAINFADAVENNILEQLHNSLIS